MGDIHTDSRLEVIETRDFKSIKDLIFHEDIAPNIISHNYEDAEKQLDNKNVIYYLFRIDDIYVGFCALLSMDEGFKTDKCYLVDIGFIKNFRGKLAYNLAKMALIKFMNEVKPNRLFAAIKSNNRQSLFFAMNTGFEILMQDNNYYFLEAKKWAE